MRGLPQPCSTVPSSSSTSTRSGLFSHAALGLQETVSGPPLIRITSSFCPVLLGAGLLTPPLARPKVSFPAPARAWRPSVGPQDGGVRRPAPNREARTSREPYET